MTLREAKQVIDEYLAQGMTEDDVLGTLYLMYQDDSINLEELEKLIGLLGYEFTEEFKNMSDEDKKTKGLGDPEDDFDDDSEEDEEDIEKAKSIKKESFDSEEVEKPEEKPEDEDETKAKKLFGLNQEKERKANSDCTISVEKVLNR